MERTARASVMRWFKRSSPRRDESPSNDSKGFMRWFKRSTGATDKLRQEVDVVPKTEINSSRQALHNINLALNNAGSSGEASGLAAEKTCNKTCSNKFCCGNDQVDTKRADTDADESIKANSKSRFIVTIVKAEETPPIDKKVIETASRRRAKQIKNCDDDSDNADYGRMECRDSPYANLIVVSPGTGLENEIEKKKADKLRSSVKSTKPKALEMEIIEKSELNYKLLSKIEKGANPTKYNLRHCRQFNEQWYAINRVKRPYDDKQDDDTRTIQEFHRLSCHANVLLHFLDIDIEIDQTFDGEYDLKPEDSQKLLEFSEWMELRGAEMTGDEDEGDDRPKRSWIMAIVEFFNALRKFFSKSNGSRRKIKVDRGESKVLR